MKSKSDPNWAVYKTVPALPKIPLSTTANRVTEAANLLRGVGETVEGLGHDASQWRSLRPEVQVFAQLMERKLRANDHKDGWKECSPVELFKRVQEEMEEFRLAFENPNTLGEVALRNSPAAIAWEGIDVANMILMVIDVMGILTPTLKG